MKRILLQFDEIGRYETPLKFDYYALKKQVSFLVQSIEESFKVKVESGYQIQDASFFCDIIIPLKIIGIPKSNLQYSLRISNFGKLATINFEQEFPFATTQVLKNCLKVNGFHYVNYEDLELEYDGQFNEFKKILGGERPTWYHRYFDYL